MNVGHRAIGGKLAFQLRVRVLWSTGFGLRWCLERDVPALATRNAVPIGQGLDLGISDVHHQRQNALACVARAVVVFDD